MVSIKAWHGKTHGEHVQLRDDAVNNGYCFLSLSIHGTVNAPRYTTVMIKRPSAVVQRDWPLMTAAEFQTTFEDQAKKGFGPIIVSATGTAADPRFAAVFEAQNPIPLTRHLLHHGADDNLKTIQGMNKKARADGLVLRWASVYGTAAEPKYAAIWTPNTGKVVWNADGVLDTASEYQARYDAQVSGWCRPSHVALNAGQRYLSVFVHNEVGPWKARHGMTEAEYQDEFDTLKEKGYFPTCVQGGGSGPATRYAALFAKQEAPVAEQFNATGPVANPVIDDVIHQAMKNSPVWNASLAIVHAGRLVYARGYSWGEADWPVCQPTTRFRTASVSKTVTALAVYQLIQEGKLALTDKVQDILHLTSPGGGAPKDARFATITIRHLLENTSGLNANAYRDEVAIRNAFKAAVPGGNWTLPVTEAMCDAYIASLDMSPMDPGTAMAYNNCGYYLLGRVVAKKRGVTRPIDAYQAHLFDPLSIHRIRRTPSSIKSMPLDEARYRSQDIPVRASVMSDTRPLVPLGYGDEHLERQEGSGGLSAATTDLARLVAVLVRQADSPGIKRSTVSMMLGNAVQTATTWQGKTTDLRAGHGWDAAAAQPNSRFYGQKGGLLSTSGNVLQINGDWGLVMCWGGIPTAAAGWYPDYPDVMTAAQNSLANADDLFPQFGMPSM
ncbi:MULTISPECIES: serine hydrolase [unclassified Saccharothrix]|uniref:serine hydrolase n=1 Tax=unclassified Saccharothrix TaxID=2593673 RepID=UPI00307CF0E5